MHLSLLPYTIFFFQNISISLLLVSVHHTFSLLNSRVQTYKSKYNNKLNVEVEERGEKWTVSL
jgi:hypothetical protein